MSFDDHVASRTIWGEARGESAEGRLAVAHVIRNRVQRGAWGRTAAAVCMAPYQFSCWNGNDPNRRKMLELDEEDPDLIKCRVAWFESAQFVDPTRGSCHYKVVGIHARWAEGVMPVAKIGHHEFFANIA